MRLRITATHSRHAALLPLLDPRPDGFVLVRVVRLGRRTRRIDVADTSLDAVDGLRRVSIRTQTLHLLLPLLGLVIARLVLAAVVVGILVDNEPVGDPADEEPPEQIHGLQRRKQRKGDVLRDPALVLLRLPVELKGPHGAELGQDGVEDLEVDKVPQVAPDAHEDEEVGADDGGVDVVEDFARLFDQLALGWQEGGTGLPRGRSRICRG